ncbi:TetR/AcrR family transcriptional regulator [Pseudomarimonas arenosa]|uniref:TetR/AcrR family transcriptional regulator n=1 Tax=Pseudomarimonas arenosa TaxID=2774145 RepID=A0AAW3ZIX9_9GAMM|nr:TetR/AcrR family transcriptional regulator [Pseudomarimonas arenosa]MBD8524271.1 TetR/AcrR family transcriptional regulator [Pseudomarimonas arenosa]
MSVPRPPSTDPAATRRAILDQASALLAESGPDALSMRRLSQRIGASTIVLYTHFRDKQAILNELYVEGFERLRDDLRRVPEHADPLQYVMDLGRAYRRSAVDNPTYYQLMFSRCVPGFDPSPSSREVSKQAFGILRSGVQRCMDAGVTPAGDAAEVAHTLWGTLHGLISLELFGYLPPQVCGEARLEHALRVMRDGLCHPTTQETSR